MWHSRDEGSGVEIMKILELHIHHFGAFANQKFTFDDGLNVFCQNNGFGKSTLLAYIKAMFYGFNDTRSGSFDENDRKKYFPWDGGSCGGSLTFELNGTRYRIERVFGKKASGDTLTVHNETRGIPTTTFGANPGMSIFGIDAEGFLRTLALSERLFDEKENKSVSGRLSEVVGTGGAMDGLKEALELLAVQQKELSKRSKRGSLDTLKQEIENRSAEVIQLKGEIDALSSLSGEIEELKRRIKEEEDEIEHLQKEMLEEASALGEEEQMQKRLSEVQKEIRELREKFYAGVPSEEEIDQIQVLEGRYASEEIEEYNALCERFGSRTSEEEIARQRGLWVSLKNTNTTDDDSQFLHEHSSLDKLAGIAEGQIGEYPKYLSRKKILPLSLLLLCVGALLMIGGIFLMPLLFVGIVVIVAGVVLLVLRPKTTLDTKTATVIRQVMDEENVCDAGALLALLLKKENALSRLAEAKEAEAERDQVRAFLHSFGYDGVNVDEDFSRLSTAFAKYNVYHKRGFEEAESVVARVRTFLEKYASFGPSPYNALRAESYRLKTLTEEEKTLLDAPKSNAQAQRDEKKRRLDELNTSIRDNRDLLHQKETAQLNLDTMSDRLQELQMMIEENKAEREKQERRLSILEKAAEKLEMAKEEMQTSYLGPTRERFGEILENLTELKAGDVYLGADFKLSFKADGLSHEMQSMSRGERDLYLLITRLAIVDTLYPQGMLPPIFLDDPFVAFDDERAKIALDYLKALGEKRQILYFTCSGART